MSWEQLNLYKSCLSARMHSEYMNLTPEEKTKNEFMIFLFAATPLQKAESIVEVLENWKFE
jgi:hypothetical protein